MQRVAPLIHEIEAHVPADPLEAEHRNSILALLRGSADPFSRGSFTLGHITASLFIVDPASRSILLHHHRRLDRWLQMGGHIEGDEDARSAALREGLEESGLPDLALMVPAVVDLDVHPIPAGKGEPDHHHFDVRYVATTSAPAAIRIDEAESKELAWIPLDGAESLMNEAASSRVIRKINSLLEEGAAR
jgi:8-oxo-dGTP pyrophosphatase MutT (NUDIX family)